MDSDLKVPGLLRYAAFTADLRCSVKGPGMAEQHLHRRKNFIAADVTCVPDTSASAALHPRLASVQLIPLWLVTLLCP